MAPSKFLCKLVTSYARVTEKCFLRDGISGQARQKSCYNF